jgi:hypothetical protein
MIVAMAHRFAFMSRLARLVSLHIEQAKAD